MTDYSHSREEFQKRSTTRRIMSVRLADAEFGSKNPEGSLREARKRWGLPHPFDL